MLQNLLHKGIWRIYTKWQRSLLIFLSSIVPLHSTPMAKIRPLEPLWDCAHTSSSLQTFRKKENAIPNAVTTFAELSALFPPAMLTGEFCSKLTEIEISHDELSGLQSIRQLSDMHLHYHKFDCYYVFTKLFLIFFNWANTTHRPLLYSWDLLHLKQWKLWKAGIF